MEMSIKEFIGNKIREFGKALSPTTTAAIIDQELAITEESIQKRYKLQPYIPDDLLRGGARKFDILEQMLREDANIQSGINTLKIIRLSSGWQVMAYDDIPESVELADFVNWNFENIEGSIHDDLWEIMGALEMGHSLNEIIWTIIPEGKWQGKVGIKNIKSLNPRYFNLWVDDYNNLKKIVSLTYPQYGAEYPIEKFLVYSYDKRYENVFGTSKLRAIYRHWWAKDTLIKFWNMYLEKFGSPSVWGKYPSKATDDQKTAFLDALKALKADSVAIIPEGMEIDFKETQMRGIGFKEAIEYHDGQITKHILGQTLTSQAGMTGSYALGKVHLDVLFSYLNNLGKDVEEKVMANQLVKRLIDYNFSNVTNYPYFQFKPLEQDIMIEYLKIYIDAVSKGTIVKSDGDEALIRNLLKFPDREKEPKPIITPIEIEPKTTEVPPEAKGPVGVGDVFFPTMRTYDEKKNIFTGVRRRTFTKFEERVNFNQIDTMYNEYLKKYVPEISEIIREALNKLYRIIDRKELIFGNKMREIDNLQLPYVGEIRQKFQDMLTEAFETHRQDAKKELIKGGLNKFQEIDLRALTPEKALQMFSQKGFVIAGIERDYILKNVKIILFDAIKLGSSVKDTINKIEETLSSYFETGEIVDDELKTASRLETVIRTNISEAVNEARKTTFLDPEVKEFVPALQYSAIMDDRVTPSHAAMDGRIYKSTDPIWDIWTPPNRYNCRCLLIAVLAVDEYEISDYPPKGILPDAGFKGMKG